MKVRYLFYFLGYVLYRIEFNDPFGAEYGILRMDKEFYLSIKEGEEKKNENQKEKG